MLYCQRYWNEHYFKALDIIKDAADKAGLTMSEVALRWVSHHSLMKREYGDSVLIGASSLKHIEQVSYLYLQLSLMKPKSPFLSQNMIDLEKGPLREY